jgi:hypothetical protein
MAENGWKQVFDNTYLHNFLFYSQVCSMGQWVVFNYPMVSPKENTLLMIAHIACLRATIATYLWAKMSKNCWKPVVDDTFLHNLLFYTQVSSMGQKVVFNYPMQSPKVLTTLMTSNSYPMGHHSHSFVSKNSQKWFKTGFWQYLPP